VKKTTRIKTTWASLSVAENGEAIVCVKGNDSLRCLRFESLEQLGRALSQRALVVRKWAVAAPRDLCIVKSLSLPAADLAEAARMIEFEVPSLVPLPAEEVIYGCTVAGRQGNLLDVLVYIVKADVLERYLGVYKVVGIEPQRIIPDIVATYAWFKTVCSGPSERSIFVLAGQEQCHILTSEESNFQSGQRMHLNGDPAASAFEIAREILHQGRQIGACPENRIMVVLTGRQDLISPVEARLRSQMDDAGALDVTITAGPEVRHHRWGDGTEDGGGYESYEDVAAAGLLQLSVGAKQPHANLVPRGYLARERQRALLVNGLRVGILSLLLVFLAWACLEAGNRRLEKTCAVLSEQIAPIQKVAGGVDRKRQHLRVIQRQLSNRGRIAETIAELYETTPPAISISGLDVTWKQGAMSIDIKGQADLLPTAFEYTQAVRDACLLQTMQIINAQQIPRAGGGSVVEFKAQCSVGPAVPLGAWDDSAGVKP